MSKHLVLTVALAALFSPTPVWADSPQAEWARHGFQHGAWDCYGNCPNGRGATARPAPVKTRMTLACQHNLGDGRTLVTDGRLLPDGARFKVVSFRPTRQQDGWSYGPCTIDVTR